MTATMTNRIAILDDWQHVAAASADWSGLAPDILSDPFPTEHAAAAILAPYSILIPMRERTPFPATLIARLPTLRLIALTGQRSPSLDIAACTAQGVLVCNTGGERSSIGTAELTLGLILAAARRIAEGDAAIRGGRFQDGVGVGPVLDGRTLGIVGLGKIGARVAGYGRALGMRVLAWSRSLTAETAAAQGAERVDLPELLAGSDVVSLHVPLSPASRGLIGAAEIARMRPGAILVNTSRGPLIDQAALLEALHAGRIRAGLDVFDIEPLPAAHPLRIAPNTVLTPHVGYGSTDTFAQFYGESVENITAYLRGAPIRMMNPEALDHPRQRVNPH